MDPGGNSVLISNQSYSGSTVSFINRVDLSTNTVTTLAETPGNANGLAYDNTGRLFASIGNNTLAQLDPMTGSVIQSVNLGAGVSIDGLAFDSFTNRLYGSSFFDNSIIRFNPNNLSSHSLLMNGTQVASLNHPDGIVSNGRGDLYIVSRGVGGGNFTDTRLYDYNLIAGTLTASVKVDGLDDIAPLVGPGAIVPEPSSFHLLGLGLIGGLGIMKQRGRPE